MHPTVAYTQPLGWLGDLAPPGWAELGLAYELVCLGPTDQDEQARRCQENVAPTCVSGEIKTGSRLLGQIGLLQHSKEGKGQADFESQTHLSQGGGQEESGHSPSQVISHLTENCSLHSVKCVMGLHGGMTSPR